MAFAVVETFVQWKLNDKEIQASFDLVVFLSFVSYIEFEWIKYIVSNDCKQRIDQGIFA